MFISPTGLPQYDKCIFVKADFADGPTAFEMITDFSPVGAFWNSSIHFGKPVAGQITSITVILTTMTKILAGSHIFISLPGFEGPQLSCEETSPFTDSPLGETHWNLSTHILTVTTLLNVSSRTQLFISVPSTSSIKIPNTGLKNSAQLTIGSDNVLAPIPATLILMIPDIGIGEDGLFLFSRLQYTPVLLGVPIKISLFFMFSLSLFPGNKIQLFLPEFQHSSKLLNVSGSIWSKTAACPKGNLGLDSSGNDIAGSCGESSSTAFKSASWNVTSENVLEILVLEEIQSQLAIQVDIPPSSAIYLPKDGLQVNDKSLEIRIVSAFSSVPLSKWSIIKFSPSVTALKNVGIRFNPPSTVTEVDILLSFENVLQLLENDIVFLYLPSFQGQNGSFPIISSCENSGLVVHDGISVGSWSPQSETLVLTVTKYLSPLTQCSVTVQYDEGHFRLPMNGLVMNDASLMIGGNTTAGKIIPFSFRNTPAVGSFLNKTVLDYNPKLAGSLCDLTVSFIASMNISDDELINITLPGFQVGQDISNFPVFPTFAGDEFDSWSTFAGDEIDSLYNPFWNASWIDSSSTLVLTSASSIDSHQTVVIYVPSATGLRLPVNGIERNTIFQISTNAFLGPVPPTKIYQFPFVGAFSLNTSIDVNPRRPGQRCALFLNFTAQMDIQKGTSILFYLPNFMNAVTQTTVVLQIQASLPNSNLFQAVWSSGTLALHVNKSISALTTISVTIALKAGMVLPAQNLISCGAGIAIETQQPAGNVSATPIKSPGVYYVGSFTVSSLAFFTRSQAPVIAGFPCGLIIEISAVMNIYPGEEIILKLTGFTGRSFSLQPAVCIYEIDRFGNIGTLCTPAIGISSWDEPTTKLTLTMGELVWGASLIRFTISEAANLSLPFNGLNLAGQPSLNISCNASAGPAGPVPILNYPKIGSFGNTQLKYIPAAANAVAEIQFSFSPQMNILGKDKGAEKIFLNLKGFIGQSRTTLVLAGKYLFNISWAEETLTMFSNLTIHAGETITIVVPSSFGIKLPVNGLNKDSDILTFSCLASSGAVETSPILESPSVPVFRFTSLSFEAQDEVRAGEPCNATFRFTPTFHFSSGDKIVLHLPEFVLDCSARVGCFNRSYIQNFVFSLNEAQNFSGVEVSFEATEAVATYSEIEYALTFPGIKLPASGLKANQSNINFEVLSQINSIIPTSVEMSPAVGSFSNTPTLIWDPPVTNVKLNIAFCFVPAMRIMEGEEVSIFLPEFSFYGTPTIFPVLAQSDLSKCSEAFSLNADNSSDLIQNASWVRGTSQILFTIQETIQPGEFVSILIQSKTGIILPTKGTVTNQQDLTISSNALDGPVMKTTISSIGVGALSFSTLSFVGGVAGLPAEIDVSFSAFMDIWKGSEIKLYLPDFVCSQQLSCQTSNLPFRSSPPGFISSVSWNNEIQFCVFTVNKTMQQNTVLVVTVLSSSGIAIPAQGVQVNQQNLRFSIAQPSESVYGSVLAAPFLAVTPVRALKGVPFLSFDPPKVGVNVALSLFLCSYMDLNPGDVLKLSLPRFSLSSASGDTQGSIDGFDPITFPFSWNSSEEVMYITISREANIIPAEANISLSISADNGLSLPERGLAPPDGFYGIMRSAPNLTISIFSKTGDLLPTKLNFNPVGSFTNTTKLMYDYPVAGFKSGIALQFAATFPILQYERMQIALPNFQTQRSGTVILDGDRKFQEAYWDNDMNLMEISASQDIDADIPVNIHIPAELYLPAQGLPPNLNTLTFTAFSIFGPVPSTPIASSQAVGAFSESSISFSNPLAMMKTNVSLSFRPNMMIRNRENVGYLLPGFNRSYSGEDTSSLKSFSSYPENIISQVTWLRSGPQVVLTFSQSVDQNTLVTVVISQNEGIMLPPDGVRRNEPGCPNDNRLVANAIPSTQLPCSSCCQASIRSVICKYPPFGQMQNLGR